jgi:hypothetical protein
MSRLWRQQSLATCNPLHICVYIPRCAQVAPGRSACEPWWQAWSEPAWLEFDPAGRLLIRTTLSLTTRGRGCDVCLSVCLSASMFYCYLLIQTIKFKVNVVIMLNRESCMSLCLKPSVYLWFLLKNRVLFVCTWLHYAIYTYLTNYLHLSSSKTVDILINYISYNTEMSLYLLSNVIKCLLGLIISLFWQIPASIFLYGTRKNR